MDFRLFSNKHQLYTNSPSWPSNQRTWSDWALSPNGEVLEMAHDDSAGDFCFVAKHDKRDFAVEPFTGFYDCKGAKIYLGDIIKLQCFNLDYEIMWHIDRFGMKPLFDTLEINDGTPHHIRGQKDFSVDWRVVNTKHGLEYCD